MERPGEELPMSLKFGRLRLHKQLNVEGRGLMQFHDYFWNDCKSPSSGVVFLSKKGTKSNCSRNVQDLNKHHHQEMVGLTQNRKHKLTFFMLKVFVMKSLKGSGLDHYAFGAAAETLVEAAT